MFVIEYFENERWLTMGMHVAYLTNDLLFSSRVMSLAHLAGVPLTVVGSRQALCQRVADSGSSAIFVDLEHPESQMDVLVQELSVSAPRPKIVAYGPHVKESLLASAQAAGAESVLSRGQFDKQVGSILQTLASQHTPDSR